MTVNVDAEIGVGCPHLGEVETAYIVHGGIYLEGDTIVFALVNEDGISRLDSLYDFLDTLGLPTD